MSKLIKCKSCDKEVASSAKVCPHCGKKLKMGKMLKLGIIIIVIIIATIAGMPSDDDIAKELTVIENTQPENISTESLNELFSLMSKNTDIQRDNKVKEITGKVVQWSLSVYEVSVKNAEKRIYRIQTSDTSSAPGTFVYVYARNAAEVSKITSLITGSRITVKGKITGTFMRSIEIDLARIVN